MYTVDFYPKTLRNADAKRLSEQPTIHPSCTIVDSQLGAWTEIGAGSHLREVSFGDYSYTDGEVDIIYATVGKFTSIARKVRINPGNHPQWRVTQHHCTYRRAMFGFGESDDAEFFQWRRQHHCTIGNDVWLGHGAVVMPGVSIGNGAIVGSGAVVTKDIGAYEIAVGVPAKVIKKRFDEQTIEKIQATAWWDWDRKTLEARFEDLCDMDRFLEKYAS